jgi:hypothetical protein
MVMTLMCFCEGDDHSIMIYYPSSAGGGMKELFRKVSDFIGSYCSSLCGLKTHISFVLYM